MAISQLEIRLAVLKVSLKWTRKFKNIQNIQKTPNFKNIDNITKLGQGPCQDLIRGLQFRKLLRVVTFVLGYVCFGCLHGLVLYAAFPVFFLVFLSNVINTLGASGRRDWGDTGYALLRGFLLIRVGLWLLGRQRGMGLGAYEVPPWDVPWGHLGELKGILVGL